MGDVSVVEFGDDETNFSTVFDGSVVRRRRTRGGGGCPYGGL